MIKMRFPVSGVSAAMARLGAALAVGGALTLAAAGCAGQVSGTGPAETQSLATAEPAAEIHPRWQACAGEPSMQPQDEGLDAAPLPHFGDAFHPVAAVLCREDTQRRTDGGTDAIAVEDRADDVADLIAALRLPDELPPSSDPSDPELI